MCIYIYIWLCGHFALPWFASFRYKVLTCQADCLAASVGVRMEKLHASRSTPFDTCTRCHTTWGDASWGYARLVVKERICKGYFLVAAVLAEQRIADLFHSCVKKADRTSSEKLKIKDQITPHVKPSDCYETRVMTWDILGWWEQIGG